MMSRDIDLIDEHVFTLLKRVIQCSEASANQNLVSKALFYFLLRVANTWRSIRTLRQYSPDEQTFMVDAGVLLRAMYDACFQAEYIVHDKDKMLQRAEDYLNYEYVERCKIMEKVFSHDTHVARGLKSSAMRPEGEKKLREAYDRVKHKYLVETQKHGGKVKRSTRTRNTWYAGDLRAIAKSLNKQAEYDTFLAVFNGCVHSSARAVQAGPILSPQYVTTWASRIAARIARLNVDRNRIDLGGDGRLLDALCVDILAPLTPELQSNLPSDCAEANPTHAHQGNAAQPHKCGAGSAWYATGVKDIPSVNEPVAIRDRLWLRAVLLRRLREFFHSRGFLEVETPILSADTVVDRHLDPFWVEARGEAGDIHHSSFITHHSSSNPQSPIPNPSADSPHPSPLPAGEGTMWLQTSPEFAMKRLLAAGAGPIYQVARVFRRDEIGPLHNPEFTLVEWYRPGDGLDEGMGLLGDLCETLLGEKRGQAPFVRSTRRAVPAKGACPLFSPGPAERISYREAFERYVGVDPHKAAGQELIAAARACGIEPPASLAPDDRDGWLDLLMVERVQPHLGQQRPTILFDYPASQAALARVRHEEGKTPVAERFELYVDGIELANGYHELLDPAELRARNAAVNAQRAADGKPKLPEESRLLRAMESGLPPAVGVALGFDRLVMLAAGAANIAEVVAFPFDRA